MSVKRPVLIVSGDDGLRHQLEVALPEEFYALSAATFEKALLALSELNADTRIAAAIFSLDMRSIVVALEIMATLRAFGATMPMIAIVGSKDIMQAARNAGAIEALLRDEVPQRLQQLLKSLSPAPAPDVPPAVQAGSAEALVNATVECND